MSSLDEVAQEPIVAAKGLVLVSTPIGNLGDLTPRAQQALRAAGLVLCEDTRRTGRLLRAVGAVAPMATLHEHNEDSRIPMALDRLAAGDMVALVSDAGTPIVSDPGYRLVRAAIAAGALVTATPGPSAAITALTLSGLPPQPFLFLGFLPPRSGARRVALARVRAAEQSGFAATIVCYEAPHRVSETLADLVATFGVRPAAVARELTKRFEEVRRASLSDLAAHYAANQARGECTLVIGPPENEAGVPSDLDAQLRSALAASSIRDAAEVVAIASGLPRKLVYSRALALGSRDERDKK
jgi:16S rRNA (cytidine1402-2'-O)-methyltransferase